MSSACQVASAVAAFSAGAIVAMAAGLDGELGRVAFNGVGMYAALTDFVVAVASACIVVLVRHFCFRSGPSPDATPPIRREGVCWFFPYLGGLGGAAYVAAAVLGSPLGGFLTLFASAVASQLTIAAVIDHCCMTGEDRVPITRVKASGIVLAIIGAVLAAVGPLTAGSSGITAVGVVLGVVLGLVAGAAVAFQTVANTTLGKQLGNTAAAACVSVSVGLVITFIVCVILTFVQGPSSTIEAMTPERSEWFYWIGGICSIIAVASGTVLPRFVGVASFSIALVAGQLAMSTLVDALGWLGGRGELDAWVVVGAVCVLIGAVLVQQRKGDRASHEAIAAEAAAEVGGKAALVSSTAVSDASAAASSAQPVTPTQDAEQGEVELTHTS